MADADRAAHAARLLSIIIAVLAVAFAAVAYAESRLDTDRRSASCSHRAGRLLDGAGGAMGPLAADRPDGVRGHIRRAHGAFDGIPASVGEGVVPGLRSRDGSLPGVPICSAGLGPL